MLEIRVHNAVSQVFGASPAQLSAISNALSYRADGYIFSPRYKSGQWDGWIRVFNPPAGDRQFGKFPTGSLHRVLTALGEQGYAPNVADCREQPELRQPLALRMEGFRGYQKEAVEAAVSRTRGVIRMATGSGKTAVAAGIIARLDLPSVFVAHKIDLVEQAQESFERALGASVGILQGGDRRLTRFNVATVQTLDNILWNAADDKVSRFLREECLVLIVDEAHHAVSQQYQRVLSHFLAAYYRYGISATPHRKRGPEISKDIRVEGAFGRIIFVKDHAELAREGYLAKPSAFFIDESYKLD